MITFGPPRSNAGAPPDRSTILKCSAFFLLGSLAAAGCGEGHAAAAMDSARADSVARAVQDSVNRAQPGYIVDSILPVEEYNRRFRAGLAVAHALDGGAGSRDQLVRQFVRYVESADTAALVRLTISRAEFAYLIYPESPLSAPPYTQAPELVWMRHAAESGTGLSRLLKRLGGAPLGFRSWSCGRPALREGSNRLWKDCTVTFSPPGGTTQTLRLFASMLERNGRVKILSYANAF